MQAPFPRFVLSLLLVLLLVLCATKVRKGGDFPEYGLTAIALAQHGTPYISLDDVDRAIALSHEEGFRELFTTVRQNMVRGDEVPLPGLVRSRHGHYLAIHFFAYPALAAIPLRILDAVGVDPFKAGQLVNLLPVFVLGVACYLLFGSAKRAWLALALFLLCGAVRYLNWFSPEVFSMAALLSGLILFSLGRPLAAVILPGLAAMQNPPLLFVALFAPLLRVGWLIASDDLHWRAALRRTATLRNGAACLLLLAMAGTPVLFNLWQFGEPSLIAKFSSDPALISASRFGSFFVDPNQGVIVAFPAVAVLLLWQAWTLRAQRCAWLAGAALGLMLALVVPAMSTVNWNSGAAGPMRYVVWAAAPLLYLALAGLALAQRWPARAVLLVLLAQGVAMWHAKGYDHTEFSPAAAWLLRSAPALYNPDPEIFHDRALGIDVAMPDDSVIAWPDSRQPSKILYNARNPDAGASLCGQGAILDASAAVHMPRGWRYINGAPHCTAPQKTNPDTAPDRATPQ